ncbi:response regulator transcription factor [Pseudoalteromonas viridis]|uniref:Response regulator transcription factor n=1 Tax=Pseudoalteromonas viridis TaxID=339617 RepID=A0ABX7UZG5_9GAMM|nr:response regulator transcription factor [Pseudoalteromonas viridis]QTL34026.1 response regulator transcription factor [Pseudoalteromonas viridis]
MINVILVEDDLALAGNIIDYFELENIICDHAANGVAALNLIRDNHYQVIILDLNLPRMDGLQICQALRDEGDDTSVIMLTARDQLEDKLAGFATGCDDYLVKPFAMMELVVRVKTLAKRKSGEIKRLELAGLCLDLDSRDASYQGNRLKLSPTGMVILETLLRAYPNLVTRQGLLQAIWGDEQPDSNALKVHIHHLRKALSVCDPALTLDAIPRQGFKLHCHKEEV